MLTARRGFRQRALDFVTKPLFRRAAAVIALTKVESARLSEWCGPHTPPIVEIGNPVLRAASDPAKNRAREAIFLARLEPRKRVLDFARAAEILRARGSDVDFRIVGPDQGDLKTVEPLIHRLSSLSYEGAIPAAQVPIRLARSGVFVLPSWEEPWGNVLVSAIQIGLPVVVTESAALSETICKYGAGIIVADRSPDAIADAVEELMTDESRYQRAEFGARAMRDEFLSNDRIADRILKTYELASN
nr:glycosyltransferase family 4 protein [Microbacterium protaetiae]